ncbi:TPA: YitT family protein [Candidatus Avigastranaerophilus faecigallinarum]|nr:YitT family protein [Candidatus Avigastranaerophilus faecigallinarum]
MKTYLKDYFFLTIGALIYAFAIEGFLIPSKIIDGGVTGISMILSTITSQPLGIFIVCINLPFIILALQKLGKRFVFSTFYSILIFAAGVTFFGKMFHGHCIIDNLELFLVAIFGGLILGAGVGLIIRNGASVDGTEILAIYSTKKIPFSVGEIIMFINLFIFTVAGFIYDWQHALYSIVTYFVAYKTMDIVIEGLNESKSVFVITDYSTEIGKDIMEKMDVSVTYIDAEGGYSGIKKRIVYCVISRLQVQKIKEIAKNIDPRAFIAIENVYEVEGVRVKKRKI